MIAGSVYTSYVYRFYKRTNIYWYMYGISLHLWNRTTLECRKHLLIHTKPIILTPIIIMMNMNKNNLKKTKQFCPWFYTIFCNFSLCVWRIGRLELTIMSKWLALNRQFMKSSLKNLIHTILSSWVPLCFLKLSHICFWGPYGSRWKKLVFKNNWKVWRLV